MAFKWDKNVSRYRDAQGRFVPWMSGRLDRALGGSDYDGLNDLTYNLDSVDYSDVETGFDVEWHMNSDDPRIDEAASEALNDMLDQAVDYAKANHNGWVNRTGEAEKSIVVWEYANPGKLTGSFGGGNDVAYYFKYLEGNYGTLRIAADSVFYQTNMARQMMANLEANGFARR